MDSITGPLPSLRTSHRAFALASALLWGVVELVALWRSRWFGRRKPQRHG